MACIMVTPPSLAQPQPPQRRLPFLPISSPQRHLTVTASPRAPPFKLA
jgi:hypothetical protein